MAYLHYSALANINTVGTANRAKIQDDLQLAADFGERRIRISEGEISDLYAIA